MRQVAVPIYVKELLEGGYEEKEGWEPNILVCARGRLSRINSIGTLLRVNNQLVLDDGTGVISLRTYDTIPGMNIPSGSIVQVIGRPRKYQEELFVVAEIIREIHPLWALLRKRALGEIKSFSYTAPVQEEEVQEEEFMDNKAEHIISVINSLDSGDGAGVDLVIERSGLGEIAEDIIDQLLLDGEIFEIKPGIVKVL